LAETLDFKEIKETGVSISKRGKDGLNDKEREVDQRKENKWELGSSIRKGQKFAK